MRLIMMGTGPFAAPALQALYGTQHEVCALFTRPARPVHGRKAAVHPTRQLAEERGTPVFDPESINTEAARNDLAGFYPDLFVVADYGQILSSESLAVAKLGGINLHGSLLPKYRGAAPINWAMYHGETETGVTVIHMTPKLDAGPTIAQVSTPIGPDETAETLEPRLAALAARLAVEVVDRMAAGTVDAIPQLQSQATQAPRLKKSDGAIDWTRPALALRNQIRAFEPWPKSFSFWHRPGHAPLRLILGPVQVLPAPHSALPGTVLTADGGRIVVAAGDAALELTQLQPAGKRILSTPEFLRGYPVLPGQTFGPHAEMA